MRQIHIFLLFTFLSIFLSCESEQGAVEESNLIMIEKSNLHLLFFKKEKKLELWSADSLVNERIMAVPLIKEIHYPLGVYDLVLINKSWQPDYKHNKALRKRFSQKTKSIWFNAPDDSFLEDDPNPKGQKDILSLVSAADADVLHQHLAQSKSQQILIFPNDAREGNAFVRSLNTSHGQGELYSSLLIWLIGYE